MSQNDESRRILNEGDCSENYIWTLALQESTCIWMEIPMEKDEPAKKSCCAINKEFVSYKAHYFLLSGAHVGVIPYLPVYAKTALGCSATTVGILATVVQFSTTVSKPLFGLVADCLNQMKLLIATLLCVEVVLNLLMLTLPRVDLNSMEVLPHRHLPLSDANHILRFAPARVYDATIGLHSQPLKSLDGRSVEFVSRDVNDLNRFNDTDISIQKNGRHSRFYKNPRKELDAFIQINNSEKCTLQCDSTIAVAQCHQNEKQCLYNQDKGQFDCLLYKTDADRFCEDFAVGTKFNFIYEVKNVTTSKSMEVLPIGAYYKRHNRNDTLFCRVDSKNCSFNCSTNQFCVQLHSGSNSLYQTYQFWMFALFALIGSMCQGALYTLSDTVCYEKIRGTKSNFGKQRLWGAIGWGVIAPLTGFLNDLVSDRTIHEDYSSGWYIMAILSLFLLLNLFCMDFPEPKKSTSMCKDVKGVVISRLFIIMEINVFLLGILNAYASNYVIWYLESLGSSRIVMGLTLAVECLFGEAPFMYCSGWLISKLGHWHVVTLTFAAFSARFIAYYFITNPWVILPVELLNGITFGLFYTAMTSYAEQIAPIGTEATIQGLLGGTYLGLGSGVGCLVAGLSFDRFGGRLAFLFAGVFSLGLSIAHALYTILCGPKEENFEKLENVEP